MGWDTPLWLTWLLGAILHKEQKQYKLNVCCEQTD